MSRFHILWKKYFTEVDRIFAQNHENCNFFWRTLHSWASIKIVYRYASSIRKHRTCDQLAFSMISSMHRFNFVPFLIIHRFTVSQSNSTCKTSTNHDSWIKNLIRSFRHATLRCKSMYICWLDSCRIPRKYKNPIAASLVSKWGREVTFEPAEPCWKILYPS